MGRMTEVTQILEAIDRGDENAAQELLPLVYDELRRVAAIKMAKEPPGQTLQATALVHEAYLRLIGCDRQHWNGRGHFFRAAAEAMRRILIETARQKRALRRGGDRVRVEFDEIRIAVQEADPGTDLITLHEALTALAEDYPDQAEIVKLRYFAGLTIAEVAGLLAISEPTVKRHWAFARAWLFKRISEDGSLEAGGGDENSH